VNEQTAASLPRDNRQYLRDCVAHLEHVLPGQAPIRDFVHHNTLHGYQHLPFQRAVSEARQLTGAAGYLPESRYRDFLRDGRIRIADLRAILDADESLATAEVVFATSRGRVTRGDILLQRLLHGIESSTPTALSQQLEENEVLAAIGSAVAASARERLLTGAAIDGQDTEAGSVADLWSAALEVLGLEDSVLHPEEVMDLAPQQAKAMLERLHGDPVARQPIMQQRLQQEAVERLHGLLERVGTDLTLGGLLRMITGDDLLQELAAHLQRHLASHLDQGVAAWHHRARETGFYAAWRRSAQADPEWLFEGLEGWTHHLESLPEDAVDTVLVELRRLGLPRERWAGYLERLALELPGYSGMFLWRSLRPGYAKQATAVEMLDYLAVRLVLERIYAQRLCARYWRIEPTLDMLRWYFRRNPAEFLVRVSLYNESLPEYLVDSAQSLLATESQALGEDAWRRVAQLIRTWQESPLSQSTGRVTPWRHGWRLFQLAQHLGLSGGELREAGAAVALEMLALLDELDADQAGFIWLRAYEHAYRDDLFNAVIANHGRWSPRHQAPTAQLIFCMDDREEGLRRHLEEIDATVETLGAAGFFGVAMNWRGLDDDGVTPLCPVVVTPSHEVREIPDSTAEALFRRHRQRRGWRLAGMNLLVQDARRNLLTAGLLTALAAPVALAALVGKGLFPRPSGQLLQRLRRRFDLDVPTALIMNAADDSREATTDQPRLGFTLEEQVARVGGFLRTIGLTRDFAPLVVLVGHGSNSQNNPHRAAYDCGACSGRHGGPNARVFAAMANRPEVREGLRTTGIDIPADCRFVGCFHDTCNEQIDWFDLAMLPQEHRIALDQLQQRLDEATRRSAHERCRKFMSAPEDLSPVEALHHVVARGLDFSQVRPELGHATNAAAFIGRRGLSKGVFFDRRVFLISYDPANDPGGRILESILLAAGPVGAGINLEYYFSTVDNEHYGCGSKVTHNITGNLGVMDGANSDLRTGLPRQMIEIHEAMRLQVLVEADIDVLTAIYERQPPLQELVGNGWLLLSAKHPDSAMIHVFDPQTGWVPWDGERRELPVVARSVDWYTGRRQPLAPARVEMEAAHG